MTVPTTVIALLATWILSEVWRRRQTQHPSILVITSIPLLLIPGVAGITVAGWRLRGALSAIAQTGSGGIGQVVPPAQELFTASAVGSAVFLVLLAVTTLVGLRRTSAADREPGARLRPARSAVLMTFALMAVCMAAVVALSATRASAGLAVRMGALTGAAPPPTPYDALSSLPTSAWLTQLERSLWLATWGGAVLGFVLLAASMGARRWFSGARLSSRLRSATLVGVLSLLAAGGWQVVHWLRAAHWISTVMWRA